MNTLAKLSILLISCAVSVNSFAATSKKTPPPPPAAPAPPPAKPASDAPALFDMIDNKATTVQDVQTFLSSHHVSVTDVKGQETLIAHSFTARRSDIFNVLFAYFKYPDVNTSDEKRDGGFSIYPLALNHGDLATIQDLQKRGGDLTKWKSYVKGRGEIFYASGFNTIDVVRYFMQAGQSASAADSTGITPLMAAAHANTNDIVTLLLQSGADVNARDRDDSTATLGANCNPGVFMNLINAGADLQAIDIERNTPMQAAALCKDPALIQLMIARGAKVDIPAKYATPLMRAVTTDSLDVVKLLVNAGAKIEAYPNKTSPLSACAGLGTNPAILRYLLEMGADPNLAAEGSQYSPLMAAARANTNPEFVRLLLAAGANVNYQESSVHFTPLIVAAYNQTNIEVIKVLIDHGADKTATDVSGENAYQNAVDQKRSADILALLKP